MYYFIKFNSLEVFAIVNTPTLLALFAFKTLAHSLAVEPVVDTSSISKISLPLMLDLLMAEKLPLMFFILSSFDNVD